LVIGFSASAALAMLLTAKHRYERITCVIRNELSSAFSALRVQGCGLHVTRATLQPDEIWTTVLGPTEAGGIGLVHEESDGDIAKTILCGSVEPGFCGAIDVRIGGQPDEFAVSSRIYLWWGDRLWESFQNPGGGLRVPTIEPSSSGSTGTSKVGP
jgi:hypothetical protein